jgi:hypothetical protein
MSKNARERLSKIVHELVAEVGGHRMPADSRALVDSGSLRIANESDIRVGLHLLHGYSQPELPSAQRSRLVGRREGGSETQGTGVLL